MPYKLCHHGNQTVRYHFEQFGTGDIPLVMLHGFTGSTKNWQHLLSYLVDDFRITLIDIIGHGRTASPADFERYQMKYVATDILSIASAPINLLGYSMGGRLALYIATHYPEAINKLLLESASPGLLTEEERNTRRTSDNDLADKIEANGIAWFADFWASLGLWHTQTPQQKEYLTAGRLQNTTQGLANSLRGMGTGIMPSLWEQIENLKIPIQLIAGQYDTKYVRINQQMLKHLPNANLQVVADAGHTVNLEQSAEYLKILQHFLL